MIASQQIKEITAKPSAPEKEEIRLGGIDIDTENYYLFNMLFI